MEWICINQNCQVSYSFEDQAGHPMHQLSDALRRFSKQGLVLAQISEKLTELEVLEVLEVLEYLVVLEYLEVSEDLRMFHKVKTVLTDFLPFSFFSEWIWYINLILHELNI